LLAKENCFEQNSKLLLAGSTKENCIAAEREMKQEFPHADITFFVADLSLVSGTLWLAEAVVLKTLLTT